MDEMNLFWRQTRNPNLRETELENNVTHAFLLLLKKNKEFLNKLVKNLKIPNIQEKKKEILFQVSKKHRSQTLDAKNKFILFISSKFNASEHEGDTEKQTDIPDGLIIDGQTAILIEAKLSSSRDPAQIKRYNQTYFKNQGILKEVTWEEIHSLINLKKFKKESIAEFLSDQFKKYLEVIHLSGFSGIPFFEKEELYDPKNASFILKHLMIELKEQTWFNKYNFKTGDRPKTSPWDYWYIDEILETNPRKFPHYSIYIFADFFGIDCLFHTKEVRRILKNETSLKLFLDLIEKIGKSSPDYFFRAVHYRLLHNKEKAGARVGESFQDLELTFQLSKFIQNHKKDWRARLTQYLQLFSKEDIKQFSIMKKAHYGDKSYKHFVNPKPSLNFIKEAIEETHDLFEFINGVHRGSKK